MFIQKKSAFTLIEMLVVIAIIGILAALLMPGLRSSLESARSVMCQNNQKQVYLVYAFYINENNSFFMPKGTGIDFPSASYGSNGSWPNIMTFMQGYHWGLPIEDWVSDGSRKVIDFFRCPNSNTPEKYRGDLRRTDYNVVYPVWKFINDRRNRFNDPSGNVGLVRCLPMRDIKSPSKTSFMADCHGQYSGVKYPGLSTAVSTITKAYVDPGTMTWGGFIFMRHGSQDAYNFLYFDGHVQHWIYPQTPESCSDNWCKSN